MTSTKAQEYHDLEHKSSDHLLEHDSRRVLGRFQEAAYHALEAGKSRARMAQLCFEDAQYAEAVEDWLSAVACFLLADAKPQAIDSLERLHQLEADGKIPSDRPELLAALRNREQEVARWDRCPRCGGRPISCGCPHHHKQGEPA
jgi:hypothetical protein